MIENPAVSLEKPADKLLPEDFVLPVLSKLKLDHKKTNLISSLIFKFKKNHIVSMKISKYFVIPILALALTAAGCQKSSEQSAGSVQQNSATGKSYSPCELVLQEDFASYYPNEEIKIRQNDAEANVVGQKICFYGIGEDMKFVQISITSDADISAQTRAGGQSAESIYHQGQALLEETQTVQGIGDEAYYGGSGLGLGKGLTVLVKNKGVHFNVVVGLGFGNDDQTKHLEIENAIAKKVLERL